MVYRKPEAHGNALLPVKLMGQRGKLFGTLKLPLPPGWMQWCWKIQKKRKSKDFSVFVGLVLVCLLFAFAFVHFLACFDLFSFVGGGMAGMKGGCGGPGGEHNWGAWCETPKEWIKKSKTKNTGPACLWALLRQHAELYLQYIWITNVCCNCLSPLSNPNFSLDYKFLPAIPGTILLLL